MKIFYGKLEIYLMILALMSWINSRECQFYKDTEQCKRKNVN